MSKRKYMVSAALILLVILSACTSLSLPFASTSANPTSAANTTQSVIASKLGPGILSLEGTSQAITAEQASNLLFLWKGVKCLAANQNSSKIELAALYTQIEQSLTADQVQAISQLGLTQTELSALQAKFGAQLAQGGAPTGATTKSSSSSSSQSSGGFDGGPGGGPMGGGPGGSDMAILSGNASQISSTTATQTTPKTTPATPAKAAVDFNAIFADAIISLLQQRAG
jgi:hypothetical protein